MLGDIYTVAQLGEKKNKQTKNPTTKTSESTIKSAPM